MTDTPTLNGQILGQAERAARACLDRLLADHGTDFDQWIAVRHLALGTVPVTRTRLIAEYAALVGIDADQASTVVDQLADRGWMAIGDDDGIALTEVGRDLYETMNTGALAIGARLYGDLPADDLAATARVLLTLTERARAELAA